MDLSGARAKLDRAQQHLYSLDHASLVYAERKPYRLVEQFDLRPGEQIGDYRYTVRDLRPTPPAMAVHLGEVVHDLRSALDYLAWAAAKRPWRKTQFPIFQRRRDWDANVEPMIRSIPDPYVTQIELAQPYKLPAPGRHLLAILNHLSNQDKHRLLHTTATTLMEASPGFEGTRGVAAVHEIYIHWGVLKEGTELVRLVIEPDEPDPEVTMYGEFALGIAFSDTSAAGKEIDGESVIRVLFEIGCLIEQIYARFAAI